MSSLPDFSSSTDLTRREAIKRAAIFFGVALSPSIVRGALEAASNPLPPPTGNPLSATQRAVLSAAVERILPHTDTPGAIDVGVPAFVEVLYGSYFTSDERLQLERGLKRLDEISQSAHRRSFVEASAEQQDDAVRSLAGSTDAADKLCFQQLRQLTLVGYFTSKPVGTTVLQYDPVPGRYQGDIPLSEVGKSAWYMS